MKQPREIKFRAWNKKLTKFADDIDLATTDENGVVKVIPYNEHVEIMQFTGLLDKNGKEIYEGDILKVSFVSLLDKNYKEDVIAQVDFANGTFVLGGTGKVWGAIVSNTPNSEIIGNIYENPEFLTPNQ